MQLEVIVQQGDAEALPFADAKFDFVVSQFGHMFAPRPDVAISEMLRVAQAGVPNCSGQCSLLSRG